MPVSTLQTAPRNNQITNKPPFSPIFRGSTLASMASVSLKGQPDQFSPRHSRPGHTAQLLRFGSIPFWGLNLGTPKDEAVPNPKVPSAQPATETPTTQPPAASDSESEEPVIPDYMKGDLQYRSEEQWGGRAPRTLHDEAFVDLIAGNTDLAITKLHEAFERHNPTLRQVGHDEFFLPNDAYNTLGIAHALKGETQTALQYFKTILREDPKVGFVMMNAATALAIEALKEGNQEKLQTAHDLFLKSEAESDRLFTPSPRVLHQNLFVFYKALGLEEQAEDVAKLLSQTFRNGDYKLQNFKERFAFPWHRNVDEALAKLNNNPPLQDIIKCFQFEADNYLNYLAHPDYTEKYIEQFNTQPEQAEAENTTTQGDTQEEAPAAQPKVRFRRLRNFFRRMRNKELL